MAFKNEPNRRSVSATPALSKAFFFPQKREIPSGVASSSRRILRLLSPTTRHASAILIDLEPNTEEFDAGLEYVFEVIRIVHPVECRMCFGPFMSRSTDCTMHDLCAKFNGVPFPHRRPCRCLRKSLLPAASLPEQLRPQSQPLDLRILSSRLPSWSPRVTWVRLVV